MAYQAISKAIGVNHRNYCLQRFNLHNDVVLELQTGPPRLWYITHSVIRIFPRLG